MAMTLSFNGQTETVASQEKLRETLGRLDEAPQFELWLCVEDGPSLCMLRNAEHAWLMYLRHEGDSGFTSLGDPDRLGDQAYLLSNGQQDQYPAAWCIDIAQCYEALVHFYRNDGAQAGWIHWLES